eukprot:6186443-Pleurochrysis_carterae.AAC.2
MKYVSARHCAFKEFAHRNEVHTCMRASGCVQRFVGPSVRLSVRPSVRACRRPHPVLGAAGWVSSVRGHMLVLVRMPIGACVCLGMFEYVGADVRSLVRVWMRAGARVFGWGTGGDGVVGGDGGRSGDGRQSGDSGGRVEVCGCVNMCKAVRESEGERE